MDALEKFRLIQGANNIVLEIETLLELKKHIVTSETSKQALDTYHLADDCLSDDIWNDSTYDKKPEDVFPKKIDLERFVCYVFERRFGWSESVQGSNNAEGLTDPKHKSQINETLEAYLKWFRFWEPNEAILQSLIYTFRKTQDKPVVRSQTVIHLMDWLKFYSNCMEEKTFHMAKQAIMLGVTDVWSAIRSSCVSRLGHVTDRFSVPQMEELFMELIAICEKSNSSWQAREGCIMGINAIVRRFQWMGLVPEDDRTGVPEGDLSKCQFVLKIGSSEFSAMPEFISKPFKSVIFELLADRQLSVRENAIKAYSGYLARCECEEAMLAFEEILSKLHPGSAADTSNTEALLVNFCFLDDFEAEGLLGVCVHLIKQIPVDQLLPMWWRCFPVFSLYLSHSASTVRQVTSNIFKFIVAKDSNSSKVLKLVLDGLSSPWQPDMEFLAKLHDPILNAGHQMSAPVLAYGGSQTRINIKKWFSSHSQEGTLLPQAWEWREGRLFAYELILQFLIKNHWLYTFGSANIAPPSSPRGPPAAADKLTEAEPNRFHSSLIAGSLSSKAMGQSLKSSLYGSSSTGQGVGARDLRNRRSSCKTWESDNSGRSRSISMSSHAASDTVDIPVNHHPGSSHPNGCLHHRIGSVSQAPASLGSTSEFKFGGRAPTISGSSATSVKSFGRHYSYYKKDEGSDRTVAASATSTSASSLLALSLSEDKSQREPSSTDDSSQKETHETPSLSTLLTRVLYQCLESAADVRWELRRMGQQVLPCVMEVMRWYNISLTENFLDTQLQPVTNLMSFGACVSLRYSLGHAARLQWLLHEPPSSWQDIQLCQGIIQSITRCIRRRLSDWIKTVHSILVRPTCDRLTVIAMETTMVAIGDFGLDPSTKTELTEAVLQSLIGVFSLSHPQNTLTQQLLPPGGSTVVYQYIPQDGFLSCKAEASHKGSMIQLERYVLTEIQSVMRVFVQGAHLRDVLCVLPLSAVWIGLYIEEDNLVKHLMDCISAVFTLIGPKISFYEEADLITRYCILGLKELLKLISMKSVDLQTLKQLLDLVQGYLKLLPSQDNVEEVLQTITVKMMMVTDSKPSAGGMSAAPDTDPDLYLRSNDVCVLSEAGEEDGPPSDDDDQLDLAAGGAMPETQLLNLSGNSCHSNTSHRRSRCTSEDDVQVAAVSDDDSSDWDDWDEEEAEATHGLEVAFTEFLHGLLPTLSSMGHDITLEPVLRKMKEKETKILETLLK